MVVSESNSLEVAPSLTSADMVVCLDASSLERSVSRSQPTAFEESFGGHRLSSAEVAPDSPEVEWWPCDHVQFGCL